MNKIFKGTVLFALSMMVQKKVMAQSEFEYKFQYTNLSFEERTKDLVSHMTIEEKIAQLSHLAPGIERLGVVSYGASNNRPMAEGEYQFGNDYDSYINNNPEEDLTNETTICLDGGYWNEALHGLARSGNATVFPQIIGLGSTWNPRLVKEISTAISDEARIHHNVYGKKLTYWSPTINMLRDPRWGRTEESYTEDPYLQSKMAVAFIDGLQGEGSKYLKTVATAKHFVANNSEINRHDGSSNVPERQLREYYFPAFKAAVQEGGVGSVMSAYNAVNNVPASANSWLLNDVLRKEWGFDGFVVSDCGAISDIINTHKYEEDREKAVALAVIAGTDMECETCETEQFLYDKYLPNAYKKGYITEKQIDKAVERIFKKRFQLGEFDNNEKVPFYKIPVTKLDSKENRDLSLRAARESIVLLKNENNTLPLDKNALKSIAVIGPNADFAEMGGYSGEPSFKVTTFSGIREKVGYDKTNYQPGCRINEAYPTGFERAVKAAKDAEVAVVVLGTNLHLAKEGLDRSTLNLPEVQMELLKKVYAVNKNTVLVLLNGTPLSEPWAFKNIPSIIEAWYPGQLGGIAIADVLFGDYNPSGKLPVTFYKNVNQLPDITDYDITKGRTYWYFKGEVAYPFGHGLSYSSFEYADLNLNSKIKFKDDNVLKVQLNVSNTGNFSGDEVVQLYIKDVKSKFVQPTQKLREFKRVYIKKGETVTLKFELDKDDFSFWNPNKRKWEIEKGDFEILIGSSSQDIRVSKTVSVKQLK
ncbi:glycoside hydrolase family 3 C-terminal domain-containing protein [Joostella atrarenae]|uniref:Glycoside hydrolase family 3 C-terminal domain-containing protein n=1 Tax=Joostella atrarenae TaxID=679257 RepID=A0ABS9J2V3_9FLAO|nr:glycoside hydrolase family 3 C-terminal domain-containing protein [Joostella atrarenae]MCF8714719.1 glycoside hydrolase family 3 C-terminal domain-containing protein [Joostella atrarenae]